MGFSKGQSGNPGGRTAGGLTSRKNLAMWLRENVSEEWIGNYLRAIAEGRDPRALPEHAQRPPTMEQSLRAMTMLLERRDGMAPQHIHLEAEMRAQVAVLGAQVDPARLAELARKDPEALKQMRDTLRQLTGAAARAVATTAGRPGEMGPDGTRAPAGVLNAEAVEVEPEEDDDGV